MIAGKPLYFQLLLKAIITGLFVPLLFSCAVIVKNYPKEKPFVYQTNINLIGNFSNDTAELLVSRLKGQLDDSMKARSVSKLFWSVMKKPPVYNTENADKSVIFMKGLMKSIGYFKDSINYTADTTLVKTDQYRTTVTFHVKPGRLTRLDSINYNIQQAEMQQITLKSLNETYLKKGDPFAQGPIYSELGRLTELYRNNGYLRFSQDELIGLWDTLDVSLLAPSLDPFEQLELLQKLRERREKPTANLEIMLKPGFDSSKLVKYYIGNINVYPDYNQDTVGYSLKETHVNGVNVIYYRKLFKPKILPQNIYLYHDSLYRQRDYLKTINRFNSLGAWRLASIEQNWRRNEDTVDFNIRLTPARKYSFSTNIEGSRNQSAIAGNLLGIALNVGLQNRNFARAANQSNTNIRYGLETGRDTTTNIKFIQTRQLSLSHTIYFPRPIPNSKIFPQKLRDNFRTVLSLNAAYTERRLLYNLTTLNGSWGYEFQWKKNFISIRVPNIEYSYLKPGPKLLELFDSNPALKNIFTDGFILSTSASYSVSGGKKNNLNFFRANMEESGLLTGFIRNKFLDTNLYRFIKVDAEFSRLIKYTKSSLALRFFAGLGYELDSTRNPRKRNNLPFFKQYFSGGPNSMRAWRLRQLGQGSVVKSFGNTPERYGDVQMEANVEYRFPIATVSGVKLQGALFTDVGNIWFLKKEAGLPEEVFNFSSLGTDLAVGVGTGLRIDFNFFVIRFDYSYKAKDPSPRPEFMSIQNKWFGYKFSKGDQFQLGINYPFIF